MINFNGLLFLSYWIVTGVRFYANFRFYAIEVLKVLIYTLYQIALRLMIDNGLRHERFNDIRIYRYNCNDLMINIHHLN